MGVPREAGHTYGDLQATQNSGTTHIRSFRHTSMFGHFGDNIGTDEISLLWSTIVLWLFWFSMVFLRKTAQIFLKMSTRNKPGLHLTLKKYLSRFKIEIIYYSNHSSQTPSMALLD